MGNFVVVELIRAQYAVSLSYEQGGLSIFVVLKRFRSPFVPSPNAFTFLIYNIISPRKVEILLDKNKTNCSDIFLLFNSSF